MLSNRQQTLHNLAKQATKLSNCKFKLGAILETNKGIYVGYNKNRNHPEIHWASAEHAEMRALRLAGNNTNGSTMYVARVKGLNDRMSKPCKDCEDRMREAGVRRVIYTVGSDEIGVLRL
jgi:cytidine deaminase